MFSGVMLGEDERLGTRKKGTSPAKKRFAKQQRLLLGVFRENRGPAIERTTRGPSSENTLRRRAG